MKKTSLIVLLAAFAFACFPATAEEMEAPVPVRMVPPKYPVEMRKEGTSGIVTITCVIDEKGNVTEPVVDKSTHEAFKSPAVEALRKWKFKPAKKAGSAVALKVSIPIQFTLSDQ